MLSQALNVHDRSWPASAADRHAAALAVASALQHRHWLCIPAQGCSDGAVTRCCCSPASTWCCCRPTMRIASRVCLQVECVGSVTVGEVAAWAAQLLAAALPCGPVKAVQAGRLLRSRINMCRHATGLHLFCNHYNNQDQADAASICRSQQTPAPSLPPTHLNSCASSTSVSVYTSLWFR